MVRLTRRHALVSGVSLLGVGLTGVWGLRRLARPSRPEGPPSDACRALVAAAWSGLDPARVLDAHVHIIGLGVGDSGCYIHEDMLDSLGHPFERMRFEVYRRASQIENLEHADSEYVDVLIELMRSELHGGRAALIAFDEVYDAEGRPRPEQTRFYTPNDYVLGLAREHPDLFVPIASVHPARRDALDELTRVAEAGAVAIKWLPNVQQIDPSAEQNQAFFERLVDLELPLLTHAGEEQAVDAARHQKLGNPLRLRRPLDSGVRVIVAHCAGRGEGQDLDLEGPDWPLVSNFDLFLRLMGEEVYRDQLYGELSATVLYERLDTVLPVVLPDASLRQRLVNGSDYPVSAIDFLVRLSPIIELGLLDPDEVEPLQELDRYNPMAFDFVLKRRLRWLDEQGSVHRLPASCFQPPPGLFRGL
jgi:predicted TIM-barrel fold metal-dependent hydrolase